MNYRKLPLAVLADDLTGAADTGSQFAKVGLKVFVAWSESLESVTFDVVVLNTNTRNSEPDAAYARTRRFAETVRAAGLQAVYKKMDSTLRGNVGAELDAVMDVFQPDLGVVCPAFPGEGRTVRGGMLFVEGVPVHSTEVAGDLFSPLSGSNVREILSGRSRRAVAQVDLELVKIGATSLAGLLKDELTRGRRIIAVDAEGDSDLDLIALVARESELDVLLGGSAGLAARLVHLIPPGDGRREIGSDEYRLLLICGSRTERSRTQTLKAAQALGTGVIELSARALATGDGGRTSERERMLREAGRALEQRGHAFLAVAEESGPVGAEQEPAGVASLEMGRMVADTFGWVARELALESRLGAMFITGGDTAQRVCSYMGAHGLILRGEVLRGVAWGQIAGGPFQGMNLLTKGGSFGNPETVLSLVQIVRGKHSLG